eukprot:m.48059 g.48059  ORF g.48059 m.48059 type:complete len:61 (+) comp11007_c0_seq1:308-490(+)
MIVAPSVTYLKANSIVLMPRAMTLLLKTLSIIVMCGAQGVHSTATHGIVRSAPVASRCVG